MVMTGAYEDSPGDRRREGDLGRVGSVVSVAVALIARLAKA
jgi:hypothetical protein